jgi:Raf kinase inhibitor-like YbhB/YbcL family protein
MIEVFSSAFEPNGPIPTKYTCDGWGVSPPLEWSHLPDNTRSVAILVDDPDSEDHPFLHWLVTDLPPDVHALAEGGALPRAANVAESDAGTASYFGPCPKSGKHHYRFHVYALDAELGRRPDNRDDFMRAIQGHVLDEGELVGVYERMQP